MLCFSGVRCARAAVAAAAAVVCTAGAADATTAAGGDDDGDDGADGGEASDAAATALAWRLPWAAAAASLRADPSRAARAREALHDGIDSLLIRDPRGTHVSCAGRRDASGVAPLLEKETKGKGARKRNREVEARCKHEQQACAWPLQLNAVLLELATAPPPLQKPPTGFGRSGVARP